MALSPSTIPSAQPAAPRPQPAAQQPWSYNASSPSGSGVLGQLVNAPPPPGLDPSVAGLWGGIQQYELGPAAQTVGAQTDLLGQQNALTQQQLADSAALSQQEAGFSLGQLGIQGSNLGLQRQSLQAQLGPGGFAEQQAGLTGREQAQQLAQSQRNLRSGATASGSINTSGTQQSWADLLTQSGFQREQLALQGREQQQQYRTSMAQMDNAAKSLGISTQQVQARLQNALDQLGLQGRLDAVGVMQAVQQLQQGFIQGPWAQAIQQVLQAAGIPLSALYPLGNPNTPSVIGSGQYGTTGDPSNVPLYSGGPQ